MDKKHTIALSLLQPDQGGTYCCFSMNWHEHRQWPSVHVCMCVCVWSHSLMPSQYTIVLWTSTVIYVKILSLPSSLFSNAFVVLLFLSLQGGFFSSLFHSSITVTSQLWVSLSSSSFPATDLIKKKSHQSHHAGLMSKNANWTAISLNYLSVMGKGKLVRDEWSYMSSFLLRISFKVLSTKIELKKNKHEIQEKIGIMT